MFIKNNLLRVGVVGLLACTSATEEPDTDTPSSLFPECDLLQPCPTYDGGVDDDVGVLQCIFDALVAQEASLVSFYADSGDSTTTFEFRVGYEDGLVRQRRYGNLNGEGAFDETFQCVLKPADYFSTCVAEDDVGCFDPYDWCESTVRDGAPACPP